MTESAEQAPRGANCGVARALDIVGERWTLLIVRDLLLDGQSRYQDLLRSLDGISPNTLSLRLKTLEQAGIVGRRMYQGNPPRAEYVLTEKGRDLGGAIAALRRWGDRYTDPPEAPETPEPSG